MFRTYLHLSLLIMVLISSITAQDQYGLQERGFRNRSPRIALPTSFEVDGKLENGFIVRTADSLFFCDKEFGVFNSRPFAGGAIITSRKNKYMFAIERINKPENKLAPPGRAINILLDNKGQEYFQVEYDLDYESYCFRWSNPSNCQAIKSICES